MKLAKAILVAALVLATGGCTSPETSPDYSPFLDGYAVREEVEPAS